MRAAQRACAYLVKPATAVRVRFATNDPTPWPPELPAGENPPPGAIIDYYLPARRAGPVTLEILDARGHAWCARYTSADRVPTPDPAVDPGGVQPALPANADRAATARSRSTGRRRAWRLGTTRACTASAGTCTTIRSSPDDVPAGSDDDATGAVPHRTYPQANAPWAPPGAYTVRLTVDGERYTQPLDAAASIRA